jgi:NAD+ diphosphatase
VRKHGTDRSVARELLEYRLVEPAKLRPWRACTGHVVAEWMRRQGLPFEFVDRPGRDMPLAFFPFC